MSAIDIALSKVLADSVIDSLQVYEASYNIARQREFEQVQQSFVMFTIVDISDFYDLTLQQACYRANPSVAPIVEMALRSDYQKAIGWACAVTGRSYVSGPHAVGL